MARTTPFHYQPKKFPLYIRDYYELICFTDGPDANSKYGSIAYVYPSAIPSVTDHINFGTSATAYPTTWQPTCTS